MMYTRTTRADRVFVILAWISFTFSTFAFSFMIGMWGVAKYRFEKRGFSASYGPLVSSSIFFFQIISHDLILAMVVPYCHSITTCSGT